MGLGGHGPSSFSISVSIPTDERGLVGRWCPGCLRYFKLKPGTGLPMEACHCPYCGYAADISEFTTPEQEEYVRSVGIREAQERILKPMMRRFGESLKGIERATSRGPIQIRVEVRDQWRSIPLALYREREVETDVTCQECGLRFAVYGVFATCPDCTRMNASAVFRKSMEAARRRLILLEGGLDSEMAEGLLSDAVGSAVGAFDAVGKELCRRFASLLPTTPRNLFQNIEALSAALGKATGSSLAEALGEERYASLVRMFQVRHVYEHNLGVVDAEAIKKVPSLAAWRGRKYVLARNEVGRFSVPWRRPTTWSSGCSKPSLRKPSKTARRLVTSPHGEPASPRSTDVTTKDDPTSSFGIPYEPPEHDEAVAQYQRRSMHKLHIAEWHGEQFERLESDLATADFFDFNTERFLPAQAHADGAVIQLAAGFDAFACAVAHHYGLANPDRASLWESNWVTRLIEAAEPRPVRRR